VAELVIPDASFVERLNGPVDRLQARFETIGRTNAFIRVTEAFDRVGAAAARATEATTRLFEVASAFGQLGQLAADAATGIAGAFNRQFVAPAAEMERFRLSLTALLGSSAAAESSLDWVRDFAARTPFGVAEVTRAFIALRSLGVDPTAGTLAGVGEAAAAMGTRYADAAAAIAAAAGGDFTLLRRFGIAGSSEGGQVTLRWEQQGEQMQRLARADDPVAVATAAGDAMRLHFAGATARLAPTWSGMLAELGEIWARWTETVMSSGVMQWLEGRLSSLLGWLDRMRQSGDLQNWAAQTAAAIIRILEAIERLLPRGEDVPGIFERIAGMAETVESVVAPFISTFGGVETVLGVLAVMTFGPAIASLAVLTGTVVAFGAALLATPVGWAIGGIAAIAGIAALVWRYWEPLVGLFRRVGEGINRVVEQVPQLRMMHDSASALYGYFFGGEPRPDPATVYGPPAPASNRNGLRRQRIYPPEEEGDDGPDSDAGSATPAPSGRQRRGSNALPRLRIYPPLDMPELSLPDAAAIGAAAPLPAASSVLAAGALTQRLDAGGVIRISISDDRVTATGQPNNASMGFEFGPWNATP
jgi:hypothetical protein